MAHRPSWAPRHCRRPMPWRLRRRQRSRSAIASTPARFASKKSRWTRRRRSPPRPATAASSPGCENSTPSSRTGARSRISARRLPISASRSKAASASRNGSSTIRPNGEGTGVGQARHGDGVGNRRKARAATAGGRNDGENRRSLRDCRPLSRPGRTGQEGRDHSRSGALGALQDVAAAERGRLRGDGSATHADACILPDIFHLYKGGSDFLSLRLLSGKAIGIFHMNDYPETIARDKIKDADRVCRRAYIAGKPYPLG